MIIIDIHILDDLKHHIIDNLLYKSENKDVDDFIRKVQIDSSLDINIMEFVPYDQFKDVESEGRFNKIYEGYKATWINGNI